ncbi:hypothetical protein RhiJN_25597 [Ceratobasidium sp. AG-Ba]|nr:hypothetical protein RhiJN_11409 [Ceratobasidium sp. AG-Ba]QRV97578.1 hypothetical protein RhiJN_25597 [Ceratobasidium sp. AG-Ba]QRW12130.1 hypothetical protein RhiLY_11129 [Ceratobasidium sp. AG-Ba]
MQYRSRAVAPASPSASTYAPSTTRSAGSSSSHYDGESTSSLVYHSSEEEPEDLGDPDVLAHDICDFFGGIPAPKKAKKPKAPKAPKASKTAHVVDLPLGTSTAAQPREGGSRLRRLCKAIVPSSKA